MAVAETASSCGKSASGSACPRNSRACVKPLTQPFQASNVPVTQSIGKVVKVPFNKAINPWYRPDWIPAGLYGITKPNPPSVIPGAAGEVGSSAIQEIVGNPVKDGINKKQGQQHEFTLDILV